MARERRFYVYMTTSSSRRALYTGLTNSIYNRHDQHLNSDDRSFVGRYRAFRLVYVEAFQDVRNAIDREKQIKGWTRARKEALVRSANPQWRDLSADFGKLFQPDKQRQGQGQSQSQPQGPSRPTPGAQDDKPRGGTD